VAHEGTRHGQRGGVGAGQGELEHRGHVGARRARQPARWRLARDIEQRAAAGAGAPAAAAGRRRQREVARLRRGRWLGARVARVAGGLALAEHEQDHKVCRSSKCAPHLHWRHAGLPFCDI